MPIMKILIAYDGSQCSESALDDLNRAGLPPEGEAVIISVAEVWLPPPGDAENEQVDQYLELAVKKFRDKGRRLLNHAAMLAEHGAARVRKILPDWKISTHVTYGSPAWEIISKSEELDPDLIIVGSHGQSALSRMVLGSISQKVLTESPVSVRIARGRNEVDAAAERVIIGYDGSAGADAAVHSAAKRAWTKGSQFRIIAVTDSLIPRSIGRFIVPEADWAGEESLADRQWITDLTEKAATTLKTAGLSVEQLILEGNPKEELVREASGSGPLLGRSSAGGWRVTCKFRLKRKRPRDH